MKGTGGTGAILLRKMPGVSGLAALTRTRTTLIGGAISLDTGALVRGIVSLTLAFLLSPMVICLVVLALLSITGALSADHGVLLLGITATPAAPASLKELEKKLNKILVEMKGIQDAHRGKAMTAETGTKFEQLGAEAKEIQDEVDREKKLLEIGGTLSFLHEVVDPALPASGEQKGRGNRRDLDGALGDLDGDPTDEDVIGYLGVGQAFTSSKQYKEFIDAGMPKSGSDIFFAEGADIRTAVMPITRKHLAERPQLKVALRRALLEQKAVATITAGVVRADRQSDVVRFAEQDRLYIRDLLTVRRTNSSSVDWVTVSAWTAAAAPVAEGALKPEATGTLNSGTAPVRTLAVWMPITVQQMQDIPQLEGIIDDELRYDIRKVEDTQILWGDGTGQNLLGIFPTPGVAVGRTVGGDTFIDLIRRMMTDVLIGGNDPNGLVLDPLDWEAIVLSKGSDLHYLYQVFPDSQGALRVWGLTPVETIAARNPVPTAPPTTRERRILVGDFRRGAVLWDRMDLSVQVGMINDQFVRNLRTVLAEERVAFAVQRPLAFKYRISQALVP